MVLFTLNQTFWPPQLFWLPPNFWDGYATELVRLRG